MIAFYVIFQFILQNDAELFFIAGTFQDKKGIPEISGIIWKAGINTGPSPAQL